MGRTLYSIVLAGVLLIRVCPAVQRDKNHHDTFAPATAGEARIAQQVGHELLILPYYTIFDELAFHVEGSTVTLLGAVANPVLKSAGENVVRKIEGVTQVFNNIRVLPLSPIDGQIRKAEVRAIYGDPQIGDRYGDQALPPIHIIVENGLVALEGVVASEADRDLINIRANSVPGIFSVTNNLVVKGDGRK